MPDGKLHAVSAWDRTILRGALLDSLRKLDPRVTARNPVLLVVAAGAVVTTAAWLTGLVRSTGSAEPGWFTLSVALSLWFTVLFSNFAEALAEGRGKAQAAALRGLRRDTTARRLANGREEAVPASSLRTGDVVVVTAGELVPGDGEVTAGIASVDESAVTGESAPVIRESGGDRSAVTGGTRVLSDRIVVRITSDPGGAFLDRMIALVEGARRQKTPNEIALEVLLCGMTIIFLVVCVTLVPFGLYSGVRFSITAITALLVCLIPTTIGGLLSAIGIAGMDRLVRANVIPTSGRAVEAAGDVDIMLLDKTGTITFGNRQAVALLPAPGVSEKYLAVAAQLASLADETPEGRSIVLLAKQRFGLRAEPEIAGGRLPEIRFVPFSAQTRMSGVDLPGAQVRKGAVDAIRAWCAAAGNPVPPPLEAAVESIARSGGTPLLVARDGRTIGAVHLKDIVKGGIKERFARFRAMGLTTIMITGDNPLTAAAIAAEAGVDDFLAEATPEMKLALIRAEQAKGKLVAMTGDGTNDAPALAQADVAIAMGSGTQAAREAGNMVDLDSDPTKLLEVVEVGKQLLMTRGCLTTFSIANDVAKYFAILPAMLLPAFPEIAPLNVMALASPRSAVLAAVIFNALIIVALIPLALRGVRYRPLGAAALLKRSLLLYGLGGVMTPFAGIKLVDLVLTALGLT
ncbi:MAG TPA: potassium-transporting ATPase subunit KdpB [Thermoanaerobaculales bacterium]|nr:potassium-transporting ATPase subunit KdpB [Thermoanaerobaculales bacterium]HPA79236.1 potassium-transporting ATPase subunit KdpB [Thermoanaerobaculales bacterium]HQL28718.1 potassium-transporting ATPase subunit KdpB [Thermoanaerobaculales bacterium]HQN96768.1 potassium-transporting ATPase subunit KdpB [Thermoanaerobaculales bacterium]HQP42920.1 potassium-transporting ATPase subunit KdpB [Thermoanaerobaculales bacterium]